MFVCVVSGVADIQGLQASRFRGRFWSSGLRTSTFEATQVVASGFAVRSEFGIPAAKIC